MPTLASIDGRTLTANVGPQLSQLSGILERDRIRDEEEAARKAKEAELRALIENLLGAQAGQAAITPPDIIDSGPERVKTLTDPVDPSQRTPDQQALGRIQTLKPDIAQELLQVIQGGDQEQLTQLKEQAQTGIALGDAILAAPDLVAKRKSVSDAGQVAVLQGQLPARTVELQNMDENHLNLEARRLQIIGKDVDSLLSIRSLLQIAASGPEGQAVANTFLNAEKLRQEGAKPRAGFTLSPGQKRFGPRGREVASVEPKVASPKDRAFEALSPEQKVRALGAEAKQETKKAAKAFLLPGGGSVLSLDGGRTYKDTETGETLELPSDAIPLGPESAVQEARAGKLRADARKRLDKVIPGAGSANSMNAIDSAINSGTGPWSNVLAAVDAVIGGTFDLKTMFPKTQDNRQHLRLIKQMGKAALLNSARGAVWEQQQINKLFPDPDKFWANPDAEARKIPLMIQTLNELQTLNDQIMAEGILGPKEIGERAANNLDIRQTLALLGSGKITSGSETSGGGAPPASPQTQADFDALPSGVIFIDPDDGILRRKR